MKTLFLSLLLFISVNAQSELLTLFDEGMTYPQDQLYQFPGTERFYSAWTITHPWVAPYYNTTTNTIDWVLQARDEANEDADSCFIYLSRYNWGSQSHDPLIKTYENRKAVTTPYNGSNYDWDHYFPYMGKLGSTYIINYGVHDNSTKSPYYTVSQNSFAAFSNLDSIANTSYSYQIMSYNFDDTMWVVPRTSGDDMRALWYYSNDTFAHKQTLLDFTGMVAGNRYWAYASRPHFELIGSVKRMVLLATLKENNSTNGLYESYGILEVKNTDGVLSYYDKNGNALLGVAFDSTEYTNNLEIFKSGDKEAASWSTPVVVGDSIAVPIVRQDNSAYIYVLRRIEGTWDTLIVPTVLRTVTKFKDWIYHNGDVYFLLGDYGYWDSVFETDITKPKSSKLLYLTKYSNLFGSSHTYSILDTVYTDDSGLDETGLFHACFIQNFTDNTNYLGMALSENIGNPSVMDTVKGMLYYRFWDLDNQVPSQNLSITDSLISYWKMDEASGNRTDQVSSYSLSDVNTVTYATSKLGLSNAASFNKTNTESFNRPSNTDLALSGTDWTISFWTQFTSAPSAGEYFFFVSKDSTNSRSYDIYYRQSDSKFKVNIGNGTGTVFILSSTNTYSAGADWKFVCARYRASDKMAYITINAVTDSGISFQTHGASTSSFNIGILKFSPTSSRMNGLIDEIAIWDRKLTDAEVTYLYNSGRGRTYNNGTIR